MVGKTVSHYRILEKLGGGGMGVVYKGQDLLLERPVALKVLTPELLKDPSALSAFIREAKAASALNHPNILTVRDLVEAEGTHFIVMELVEGRTLRACLGKKGLEPRELLSIATQVGEALAAAHRAGIVHRDLKPENIMVRADGHVKVVDFGLAKLLVAREQTRIAAATQDVTVTAPHAPPLSADMGAERSHIAGTLPYMSPEQLTGKALDHRTDIFSFGVVLYEMATGQQPFQSRTTTELMEAILGKDPRPVTELSRMVPDRLQEIIAKAIEKDPSDRYQGMEDLVVDLRRLKRVTDSARVLPAAQRPRAAAGVAAGLLTRRKLAALVGAVVIMAAAILGYWLTRPLPPPRTTRTVQLTDTGRRKGDRLATDGMRVYFSDEVADRPVLYQVSVAGGVVTPVPTPAENVWVWDISPDGSELLVDTLPGAGPEVPPRIMPTVGGSARTLGNILAHDATWTPDGRKIVYVNGNDLFLASSDGSESRKLVTASGSTSWPRWSPDATRLRFTVWSSQQHGQTLWEISADGSNLHRLLPGWNNPPNECCGNWTADGSYFVFQAIRDGKKNLWATREKASLFRKAGRDPVQLTDSPMNFWSPVPSKDGKRIFAGGTQPRGELVRYDAKAQQFVPYLSGISAEGVEFSRDGAWVLYVSFPEGSLWRSRPDGSERLQLTFPPLLVMDGRWSPDGKRIAFMGKLPGKLYKVCLVSAEGGAAQQLISDDREEYAPQWSPHGDQLLFGKQEAPSEPVALHLLDLRTNQVSTLPGSGGLRFPCWSQDGRYVAAYGWPNNTNLMLFDFQTQKWEKLAGGAVGWDNWSKDGRYVYYWSPYGGAEGVYRVGIRDRRVERVASLTGIQSTGIVGFWLGLGPDDSPLLLRDTSIDEIYALDWEAP